MPVKPVWLNTVERDAFVEKNCARCFQPDEALKRITDKGDGCPHLARAENNKMPAAWTRRRNAVMGDTYRCADHLKQPPVNRRASISAGVEPMLDVPTGSYQLVPVDGWPDYRAEARKTKGGEHA